MEDNDNLKNRFFIGKPYYILNTVFIVLFITFASFSSWCYHNTDKLHIDPTKISSINEPWLRTQYTLSLIVLVYIFCVIIYRAIHSTGKRHHNYTKSGEKEDWVMPDTTEKFLHLGTYSLGIIYSVALIIFAIKFKDTKSESLSEQFYLNVTNSFMGSILLIFSLALLILTLGKIKDGYYEKLGEKLENLNITEFGKKLQTDLQKEKDRFDKIQETLETQINRLEALNMKSPTTIERTNRISKLQKMKVDNAECLSKLELYKEQFKNKFDKLQSDVKEGLPTENAKAIIKKINVNWAESTTEGVVAGAGAGGGGPPPPSSS